MGIGWSIHRNDGWAGQLQRVQRWHERLVRAGRADGFTEIDLHDFVFTFFQNCFHLREWVQKTSDVPRAELDAFMCRPEMLVCRDLANGTKHLNVTRPSVDPHFSIVREYDPRSPHGRRLFVIAGDEKHDLLDLAAQCLVSWREFLAAHRPGGSQEPLRYATGPSPRGRAGEQGH